MTHPTEDVGTDELLEALRFEFGSLESAANEGLISLGPEARCSHERVRALLARTANETQEGVGDE